MLLSLRKNGLTSLFKEVRVFKGIEVYHFASPFASDFPVGENVGFMQEIL